MDSQAPVDSKSVANTSVTETSIPNTSISERENRIHIDPPASGVIQVIDVQSASEIAFNFDLSTVRVSAIDVDLVLLFPDSSKLILPGLAMDLLGANAPRIRSLNKVIHAQDVVASIANVNLVESTPSVHLASSDFVPKKQGGNASNDQSAASGSENAEAVPAASAMPVVTPVRPTPTPTPTPSASGAKVENVEAGSIASSKLNSSGGAGEPPVPKNPPPSSSSQASSAAKGSAPFSIEAAELTIKAYAIATKSVTEQTDGKILIGGSGAEAAADDASFAAQSARETLAGGIGNDLIYADDPRFSSSGTAARLLDVTVTMPTSSISASSATISGLPAGYSILNAENINGTWVMPVGLNKPNNFQIQLVYKIPDDAEKPDANGFYNRFVMSISFDGTNGGGSKGSISAAAVVGVRDVNSAVDQNFIDPVMGTPVVVLYRRPAGNEVDAGSGDDTIYAAAGADQIDGGDGNNLVNYGNSQSGVSVNLENGEGKGGFASGDVLTHIRSLVGSRFADTLIGNQEDNTLAGAIGADSLVGGAGNDVADYSASASGVTVNLQSGEGLGGDAQGDRLALIEQVIGSAQDDLLTASNSGSTLQGGKGNDTLISGAAADSLIGGAGVNHVDYRNSSAAVTVDLLNYAATGGDAEGDLFSNIQNIRGSANHDWLRGDYNDNILDGNLGQDTLIAGLGNDTLDGGTETDTIDYSYVIASGTTNGFSGISLTLNGTTAATVSGLVANDQDSIRNIENVIGTNFNDWIRGDNNNNSLSGGAGDDYLSSVSNGDTLDGGAGNDTLNITNGTGHRVLGGGGDDMMLVYLNYPGSTGSIDGGAGNDTLSFAANSGDATLTSSNFANILTNTEVLDFTAVGTNVTMSLTASDLSSITGQALTAGSTAKLDIFQNAGDSISMAAQAGYTFDTSTANGVTTYTVYNSNDPQDPAHQLIQLVVH